MKWIRTQETMWGSEGIGHLELDLMNFNLTASPLRTRHHEQVINLEEPQILSLK